MVTKTVPWGHRTPNSSTSEPGGNIALREGSHTQQGKKHISRKTLKENVHWGTHCNFEIHSWGTCVLLLFSMHKASRIVWTQSVIPVIWKRKKLSWSCEIIEREVFKKKGYKRLIHPELANLFFILSRCNPLIVPSEKSAAQQQVPTWALRKYLSVPIHPPTGKAPPGTGMQPHCWWVLSTPITAGLPAPCLGSLQDQPLKNEP